MKKDQVWAFAKTEYQVSSVLVVATYLKNEKFQSLFDR